MRKKVPPFIILPTLEARFPIFNVSMSTHNNHNHFHSLTHGLSFHNCRLPPYIMNWTQLIKGIFEPNERFRCVQMKNPIQLLKSFFCFNLSHDGNQSQDKIIRLPTHSYVHLETSLKVYISKKWDFHISFSLSYHSNLQSFTLASMEQDGQS